MKSASPRLGRQGIAAVCGTVFLAGGIFLYLQRPRELDVVLGQWSPDRSVYAHGRTIGSTSVFGSDAYKYRLTAEDRDGNTIFRQEIEIPREIWRVEANHSLRTRGISEVTFKKNGTIVWADDQTEVAFVVHGQQILRRKVAQAGQRK